MSNGQPPTRKALRREQIREISGLLMHYGLRFHAPLESLDDEDLAHIVRDGRWANSVLRANERSRPKRMIHEKRHLARGGHLFP